MLKKFNNLSIQAKLISNFAVIVLISVVTGGMTIISANKSLGTMHELEAMTMLEEEAAQLQNYVTRSRTMLSEFIISGELKQRDAFVEYAADAHKKFDAMQEQDMQADLKAHLALADKHYTGWSDGIVKEQLELMRKPKSVDVARLLEVSEKNKKIWVDIEQEFASFSKKTKEDVHEASADLSGVLGFTSNLASVGLFVLLLTIAAGSLFVVRFISKPLRDAIHVTEELRNGNWNVPIHGQKRGDEIGRLLRSLVVFAQNGAEKEEADALREEMNARRQEVSNQVNDSVKEMLETIAELAAGNNSLSERTESQAAGVEETTASMTHIMESVNASSDKSSDTLKIVMDAQERANRGQKVADSAVQAMGEITEASTKITEIIQVIDDIAFQTNLLALNAAVEAARAGEQGRGFAVVASEVRSLAGRSASAASEIKELITDSVAKIQAGSHQVKETGDQLSGIAEQVGAAEASMAEIADSLKEQSTSVAEVNVAITEMDNITQQNAALVEEAAAASESLKNQVQAVVQVIDQE